VRREIAFKFAPPRPPLFDLYDTVVDEQRRALRISEDHYLVQWEVHSRLWCVINMGALDEHAEICSALRQRQHCEHLDSIYDLCVREERPDVRSMH